MAALTGLIIISVELSHLFYTVLYSILFHQHFLHLLKSDCMCISCTNVFVDKINLFRHLVWYFLLIFLCIKCQ